MTGRLRMVLLGAAVPAIAGAAFAAVPADQAVAGSLLGWGLLVVADQDVRTLTVPTLLIGALALLGLAATTLLAPDRLVDHTVGMAAGGLMLLAVAWAYRRVRGRAGLGEGDVLLLACAGAWVGWRGLPSVVVLAALGGLLTAVVVIAGKPGAAVRADAVLPFAPFLCLATWLVWMWGPFHA